MSAEREAAERERQRVELTSTEPHSCECGESRVLTALLVAEAELQRSRTRVSAERPLRWRGPVPFRRNFNGAALV